MECEALEEMSRASLDDSLTSIQWLCQLESNKLMQNNLSTTGKIRESPAVVETHFHGNTNKNPYPKPHYSYATLIVLAINSSKEKRMTLQEIYSWIEEHYPFYRFAKKGWKNSIRHNLSLHKFFVKEKRANVLHGKGSYWRISPEGKENLMRDLLKQSNHNLQPPCTLLPHDPDRKLRPIMPKPNCDQDSAKVHYVPFLTCNLPIKFVPTTTAVHSGTDEVTIAPSAATVVRALDSPVDTARPFRITADSTKLSGMAAGTNEMFGSTKATLFSDAVTRTNETTGVATENAERSGTALGTVEASGTAQGTDGTGLTTVVTTPTPTQSETTPVRTPLSSRTSNSSRGLPYSSDPRGSSASKKNRARRKTRTRTSKKRDEIHLAKTRHQNSSPSNSRNLPNILRRKRKTQPRSPGSNGGGEEQVPQGVVAQPTLAAINCTNQPMSSPKRGFDDFINSLASSPVAQCNSPFDFLNCFSSPGFSPLRSPVRFSTGLTPLRHEVDSGIMITPVHGGLGDIGFNWTPFKSGFTPLVTSPPRNTTRNGGGSQGCRKSLGLEKINEVDSVLE